MKTESGAVNFVKSELFARTFSEGMTLVEETANYLDGDGRITSKALPRDAALGYAASSMRLTTQLMQIASWLLVMRALREGEMSITEACDEKYRVRSKIEPVSESLNADAPQELSALISRALALHQRIARLDLELFNGEQVQAPTLDAHAQQEALLQAFGQN
ncbi:MAG: DUF1465 family protein [Pseudomonadota bacterium]